MKANDGVNPKYQYLGVQSKSVRIKEKGLWGINSLEGEELLPIDYLELFTLPSGFGLIAARKEGSWSLFDSKGNKIGLDSYDYIYPYYGLFSITKVRIGNKWGLINKYGEKVTSIKYKNIERFGKGITLQKFNMCVDFIDYKNVSMLNNLTTTNSLNFIKESAHKPTTKLRKKIKIR